jgi:hypothetical protein
MKRPVIKKTLQSLGIGNVRRAAGGCRLPAQGRRRWYWLTARLWASSVGLKTLLPSPLATKYRSPETSGRTVARTDTQMGWSAKPFEVMESELAIVGDDDNVTIQVNHLLRETAAAVYDWSSSEEQAEDILKEALRQARKLQERLRLDFRL